MQTNSIRWLYLVVLALIWGSSFILIKKALVGLSPIQLGALRVIISGLFLFLVGIKSLKGLTGKTIKWLIISGFLGTFFPAFLFAYAETEIDSAVASILNSLVPLSTIIMGVTLFQIGASNRQWIGVLVGLVGTVLLILNGAAIKPDQNYYYAILVVIATVMYALNVNIIKKHLQQVPPMAIACGNFAAIIIPAIIILIANGFFTKAVFTTPELPTALGYLVLLCLFGTAMAKVIFNKLVQISTPVFASSVTYLMPLVAVLWGFLDGEGFSWQEGLAALLILCGVWLANSKGLPKIFGRN